MNFKVRRASVITDYKEICQWWKEQGRAILSWQMLPVLSFICEDEEEKISVCWLYCTDSVTGFVAWFTVNPKVSKRKVLQSIRLMDECVEGAARAAGCKILFQFSGGGGFTRKMVKSGWLNTVVQHDFLMKEV
jgi:hypothetical protein